MTINIPTPLRTYTAGAASIPVDAGTVSAALEALVTAHPGLRANLFAADGKLRSFVNIYLNEDDIRYLPMKEDSPTSPSDELTIIPSIAGGNRTGGACNGFRTTRLQPRTSLQELHRVPNYPSSPVSGEPPPQSD